MNLAIGALALALCVPLGLCCWGSGSTNIGVSTPDQKILSGEDLKINCTLHNTSLTYNERVYDVDSSMIAFKFKTSYLSDDKVSIVNRTEAQLTVKQSSLEDNGMYYCFLNISGLDHNPLVCVSHVTVGYKPQPVKDFKCISLHLRLLVCSWRPQWNPIPTNYNLYDRIYPKFSRACGYSPNASSCEWRTDTVPPYRITAKKFNLELVGENDFGRNEQLFTIDHYSIIKPNITRNLRAINVTEKSITISWQPPAYIDIEEEILERIVYEIRLIRIAPISTNRFRHRFDESLPTIIDNIRNNSYALSDLIPFTRYNISIRCKTQDSTSDEFWSDYDSIIVTTNADVPYQAPVIIPESFETVKNTEGNRSITLYWKAINALHFNGPNFYYRVEYEPTIRQKDLSDTRLYVNINPAEVFTNATFRTFTHMDPNKEYYFKIYGVNDKGISKNFTEITVDKSENMPHKATDIDVFSYGSGRYELQWKKPRDAQLSIAKYAVFWCLNLRPRPFPCIGSIDWTYTSNKSIALQLPDKHTNYQFAVSSSTVFSSSGMSWATCIVPIDGKLDKINEVYLEVLSSVSIKVTWKLDCSAQKRVVEKYKISYCKTSPAILQSRDCTEPMRYAQVSDNLANNYILAELSPYSMYKISVVAFTDNGPSEESNPKYAKTSPDSPDDAPSQLTILDVTHKTIELSWSPPKKPNGKITYYDILSNGKIYHVDIGHCSSNCSYNLTGLNSYETYKIQVRACVTASLCSPYTSNEIVQTAEWIPDQMHPPRSEVINSSFVRISWNPPSRKNGPISYYMLRIELNGSTSEPEYYNISGFNDNYVLKFNCDSSDEEFQRESPYQRYMVKVLAVNKRGDEVLYGNYSDGTYVNSCLGIHAYNGVYLAGIIAGSAFGLTLLVFVLYMLVRWMKKKMDYYKSIKIQLPSGLEAPPFVTDDYDNSFNKGLGFNRSDSTPDMRSTHEFVDDDLFKNRHGSGISNVSNTSTEGLMRKDSNSDTNKLSYSRQASGENGAHGSVSSTSSNGEVHVSSDSGAEIDALRSTRRNELTKNKISPKLLLPIVDELCARSSDSSGSRDSGLDLNSSGNQDKRRRKKSRANKVEIVSTFPTKFDVKNPLYDSTLNHTICTYSLLSNSEPSIFDLPIKEDDNILNDLSKYYKPEMAKSLSNIIQNSSPYSKTGFVGDSNRSPIRASSPVYQYSKFGVRRQFLFKNNYVPSDLRSTSPNKRTENKTTNGYITIESILNNGDPSTSLRSGKKRLDREKDWSQTSYDAEVSSTSSNGDNNDQTEIISHPVLYSESSGTFSECEKIQNNSLVDLNSGAFTSPILSSISPSKTLPHESENNTSDTTTSTSDLIPTKSLNVKPKYMDNKNDKLIKNSNGYVIHESLNQNSANNINQVNPHIVKNGNGYVTLPEIEMKHVFVPNNIVVNHITQV